LVVQGFAIDFNNPFKNRLHRGRHRSRAATPQVAVDVRNLTLRTAQAPWKQLDVGARSESSLERPKFLDADSLLMGQTI
jgi:hypothetical protein